MVKSCAYNGCRINSKSSPDVKFVAFPKPWVDRERTAHWLRLIGSLMFPEEVNDNTRLCINHFDPSETLLDWKKNQSLTPREYEFARHVIGLRKDIGPDHRLKRQFVNKRRHRQQQVKSSPIKVNAASQTAVIGEKEDVNYLEPDTLLSYAHLRLVSSDGFCTEVNAAAFGALSKYRAALLDPPDQEPQQVIITETPIKSLALVVKFILTGCMPMQLGNEDIKSFADLGIDIVGKRFIKIPKNDVPLSIRPVRTPEPPSASTVRAIGPESRLVQVKIEQDDEDLEPPIVTSQRRRRRRNSEDGDDADDPAAVLLKLVAPVRTYKRVKTNAVAGCGTDPKVIRPLNIEATRVGKFDHTNLDNEPNSVRLPQEFRQEGERDNSMDFQCDKCLFGTNYKPLFREHRMRHKFATVENNLFFFCEDCTRGFEKTADLREHFCPGNEKRRNPLIDMPKTKKTTERDVNLEHQCACCFFGTNDDEEMTDHTEEHAAMKKAFLEENCQAARLEKEFPKVGERNMYNKYQCHSCLYGTHLQLKMDEHQLRHEKSTLKNGWFYFCKYCKEGYIFLEERNCHQEVCPERFVQVTLPPAMKKVYLCNRCDKKFQTESKWKEHLAVCDDDMLKRTCIQCGEEFNRKSECVKHMNYWGEYHTGKKNQEHYKRLEKIPKYLNSRQMCSL